VTATVVSDHPEALIQEEHHLTVPVVGTQWPAVMKEERLTRAPILVEDLRAIRCCEDCHAELLFCARRDNISCCPVNSMPSSRRAHQSSRVDRGKFVGDKLAD
jgi:hypothetical protein